MRFFAEQFLNSSKIIAIHKQMGGKRVCYCKTWPSLLLGMSTNFATPKKQKTSKNRSYYPRESDE